MTKPPYILVFGITLAVLFTLLSAALFRLQVVKGADFERIAESNFVRIRRIIATRGEIYDHKYRPIAQNIPSHNLFLTSGKIRNLPALSRFLEVHFGIKPEELKTLVMKQRFKTYEEILLADKHTLRIHAEALRAIEIIIQNWLSALVLRAAICIPIISPAMWAA
jgi:penicillin-binding protein 2